jgi:hypothetical protein
MKNIIIFSVFFFVSIAFITGCSNRPSVPAVSESDLIGNIKAYLQRYESGEPVAGDEEQSLERVVVQLKQKNAAKGEIAEKALNDCKTLNGKPAEQKKVATEALGKL